MRTRTLTLLAVTAALAAGGCKSSKSSNPLSPSIAGPIAGVSISAPKPVQPNAGATIEVAAQPVTLILENATTTGQRPLSYLVEVALDSGFANKVLSRDGIAPGADGKTAFKLPEALAAERTYYWRARAQDGANTGPYSGGGYFNIVTPVVLQAPQLQSPIGDARIANRTPAFRFSNVGRSGPVTSINYILQVSSNESFSQIVAVQKQAEQPGSTQVTYNGELSYNTRYFWRVQAEEPTKSVLGPWSGTGTFYTPAEPAPTPEPTPGPTPGTGGPVKCGGRYPNNGPDVVDCVAAAYPQYLAPVGSVSERYSNMDFLRDRIIETGICGGMDLGRNAKRGDVNNLSHDFLVERIGGAEYGHDIGADWDNNTIPLRLYWGSGTMPFYVAYSPRPSCQ